MSAFTYTNVDTNSPRTRRLSENKKTIKKYRSHVQANNKVSIVLLVRRYQLTSAYKTG